MQKYDFYFSCARVWGESDDLTGVFNSCWVFRRAKCGIYKPIWVDYKLYWGMWEDGIIFVASLWTSGRTTAKWMLAFTKLACMIWGISLLSQLIIGGIIAESLFQR